jgi:Ca2+-transporting ATPase
MEPSAVLAELHADPVRGLTAAEAAERMRQVGSNEIRGPGARHPLRILLAQFGDFLVLLLLGAAAVSFVLGDVADTIVIAVIVGLDAAIGFAQEWRAERALDALRQIAAATAAVVRGGESVRVPAVVLVPGDVVLVEAGDVVPADLRLLEAIRLRTDESPLTGESVTVGKDVATLADPGLSLGDRRNLLWKGTQVTQGRGRGIVVATGAATALGGIAELVAASERPQTPLQRRLAVFGRRLSFVVLAICAFVFVAGVARGEPTVPMLMTAISLAVAAVPEALPAVVTVLLALGARRMAAHHALVRHLSAVESLGSVTFVGSDKTGTLTKNEMRVEALHGDGRTVASVAGLADGEPWRSLLRALALCNDAKLRPDGSGADGDPTETALLLAAHEGDAAAAAVPRIAEVPFDAERKRMTTVHRDADGWLSVTKGAPEVVLARCATCRLAGGEVPIDRQPLLAAAEQLAAGGHRVLAVAQRRWSAMPPEDPDALEEGLCCLGLVGLLDPPRAEAATAVQACREAGITPVMITGDHPATARAIAQRLGIARPGDPLLTGSELAGLGDAEFAQQVACVAVYARVDPAQKLRIVRALQQRGQFVAMTGDGVNDAPALKQADVGIAMGRNGTEVARQAASLVLLDDHFATIVQAVREGRRIFDNIRKFIRFALSGNSGEIWTILLAPMAGLPLPLLPIHILWVNLVTDGLPGLALAAEPEESGVMKRPPRPPQQSLFANGLWQHVLWVGLLIGGVTLLAQAIALHGGGEHDRTMAFTVLTLAQMAHALAIRSERDSLFTQGLTGNLPLLGAVGMTFLLQMAVVYVPPLQRVFHTGPLGPWELAVCLLLAGVVFLAVEVEKLLLRRGL